MQKINYQLLTDRITKEIAKSGSRPRLLLHACCAPCASYVLEYLTEYFDIDVYFYNPNILPEAEYEKRLSELRRLISLQPYKGEVSLIEGTYEPEVYLAAAKELWNEPEGGRRCTVCLDMRVSETARLATEGGYDYFATTLTVSPHKNAELLNTLGYAAAEKHGAVWLPSDFKKRGGYLRSTEICREYGIYRQNYCGCKPSEV
ncbi:MAG: epoxyqueuosine reductase QueH [Clostridia bacterium]|nr:epoxyqueuosine reductase QueH [Clostridia bacterium]